MIYDGNRGPIPTPNSPEGLGAMMAAGGYGDVMRLYRNMKAKLSLRSMAEVEGGVIGRIFNEAMDGDGNLNPQRVRELFNSLSQEIKDELWGKQPAALDAVEKFADCMADLQMASQEQYRSGQFARAADGLACVLELCSCGVELSGAGDATVPWRLLTNPTVVAKLTAIADRSEAVATKDSPAKVDVIRVLQQNQKDLSDIAGVLIGEYTGDQMALTK